MVTVDIQVFRGVHMSERTGKHRKVNNNLVVFDLKTFQH